MNSNWTGKLKVILLSDYIYWNKLCLHTFKASAEDVIMVYSEKMKKIHEGGFVKELSL